jgi:carbamoyl-phosphate synthase large subunit
LQVKQAAAALDFDPTSVTRGSMDIGSILIPGAGPIVIGQACEFDYSGAQACKALKTEGYRVILVNSNPAAIMTDPELADATYVEPLTPEVVERIIEKERPDSVLPTLGGQTALNLAMELAHTGVVERHGVEMIGANADVIEKAECRERFRAAMERIGIECPRGQIVDSVDDALAALEQVGLPTGIDQDFATAYLKAQLGAGTRLPRSGNVLLSVRDADKPGVVDVARRLADLGLRP